MRTLGLFGCLLPLFVSGCASLPDIAEPELTTPHVIHHIKCEIRDAAIITDPNNHYFRDWGIGNTLTLNADHTGSLTASAGLTHPLLPQIFDLSGSATASGQGIRTERIEFHSNISTLRASRNLDCDSRPIEKRHALLGGNLGIKDLLGRVIASVDDAKIDPKQLDYTIKFTITKSADATARFSMLPWGGLKTGTLSGKWSGKRIRTHRLAIVLKPPKKARTCLLKFKDDADKETFKDICPEDIVSIGPDGVTRFNLELFRFDKDTQEKIQKLREPRVESNPGARARIRREQEERRIQRALDRSTLQSIVEGLRDRDIVP